MENLNINHFHCIAVTSYNHSHTYTIYFSFRQLAVAVLISTSKTPRDKVFSYDHQHFHQGPELPKPARRWSLVTWRRRMADGLGYIMHKSQHVGLQRESLGVWIQDDPGPTC